MSVAVIFHRLGPYHSARIRAAAGVSDRSVTALELSAKTAVYDWDPIKDDRCFNRVTITADDSSISPKELRKSLLSELNKLKPEVVFVPGWSGDAVVTSIKWCLQNNVPAIVMSESSRRDGRRIRLGEFLKSRLVSCFSAGLVGGARHREYLASLGMPLSSVKLGYDAIDCDFFETQSNKARANAENERSRLNLPSRFFLASARFVPKKNIQSILFAYSKYVATTVSPLQLVLLGDGPMRGELLGLVSQLNLESLVHFPGFRQYQDLPSYYGLATAFIHASQVEQWGLVVNEAMACGLPIIVSEACGCSPELVHDQINGFSFAPFNTERLAEILELLEKDERKCKEFGQSSRRIIADWGTERFAKGFWEAVEIAERASPIRLTPSRQMFLLLATQASRFARVH